MDSAFLVRTVTIPGGRHRAYDQAEWRGAIVVVERGRLVLEYRSGTRQHLLRGDVLWLAGLPLLALHNPGTEPTVLVAVARRPADNGP